MSNFHREPPYRLYLACCASVTSFLYEIVSGLQCVQVGDEVSLCNGVFDLPDVAVGPRGFYNLVF